MDDPILEKRLKNMFESRAGELPDESVRKARIRRNVYEKIEREGNYMKKGFMKKAVAAVAAICVFGSMTAFAIGKIAGITSRTDIRDEVHTYEQALELQKENGPMVDFPEKFSNGYAFKAAVPVNYETKMEINWETEHSFPSHTEKTAWRMSRFPRKSAWMENSPRQR